MKVIMCWAGISGYMAACWRALAAMDGIDLEIVAYKPAMDAPAPFDTQLLSALHCHWIDKGDLFKSSQRVIELVVRRRPDVIVLPGWIFPLYRRLPFEPALHGTRFVMGMDTPWRGDWRQRLARWRLRSFLRHMDRVVVPGERAWQYARRLGVPEWRLRRGLYGIDYHALRPSFEKRRARSEGWPERLLFVGRYASIKGLDVLLEAHSRYRAAHTSALALSCCGRGAMQAQVRAAEGVTDHGFVQPGDLPQIFTEHGVFVLASRYDPWPLAIVEACAAGLPVICTEACGSAVELVRPYENGLIIPTDDVCALTEALTWVHTHWENLAIMGERGSELAAPYRAEAWATRWADLLHELSPR